MSLLIISVICPKWVRKIDLARHANQAYAYGRAHACCVDAKHTEDRDMRKIQQELTFDDSFYIEASVMDAVKSLGRMESFSSYHQPLPENKRNSIKVFCLECSRRFTTKSFIPTCPGCGSSDIELA